VDPLLAPHLCGQLRVERLEDPRVAAGGEVAEHASVEAVLRLRNEVEEIVREPVVVADRPAPEVGIAVATHLDGVPPLPFLDERDLHPAGLLVKNA